jgi:hypothetical protein
MFVHFYAFFSYFSKFNLTVYNSVAKEAVLYVSFLFLLTKWLKTCKVSFLLIPRKIFLQKTFSSFFVGFLICRVNKINDLFRSHFKLKLLKSLNVSDAILDSALKTSKKLQLFQTFFTSTNHVISRTSRV